MNFKTVYLTLVAIGLLTFIISIFSPLISVSQFYVFESMLTIYSALLILLDENEWLLFIIIMLFAIVLPLVKYLLLLMSCLIPQWINSRHYRALEFISKWAMLDVFVVAMIVAGVKLKMMASAQTHYGLYLFVISVLISIVCAEIQKRLLNKNMGGD